MPAVPIQNANGNTSNVATTEVTVNGIVLELQVCVIGDPISGNGASVEAPGTNGSFGLAIQGLSGGLPVPVNIQSNGALTSTLTSVGVGTSSTTLLNANTLRLGVILYNSGTSVVFVAYAASASLTAYSFQIAPGEIQYIDTLPYRGQISAIVGAPADGSTAAAQIMITELTP